MDVRYLITGHTTSASATASGIGRSLERRNCGAYRRRGVQSTARRPEVTFTMTANRHTIVASAAFLVVGLISGYWLHGYQANSISDEWHEIGDVPLYSGNVSYSNEAFTSDIALPAIKSINAKVKFRPPNDGGANPVLGYVMTIEIANLDKSRLPEKYRAARPAPGMKNFELAAVQEVTYEAHTAFSLLDKDGFLLLAVQGPQQSISSGKSNVLQDVVATPIPAELVRRTVRVSPKVSIDNCASCE